MRVYADTNVCMYFDTNVCMCIDTHISMRVCTMAHHVCHIATTTTTTTFPFPTSSALLDDDDEPLLLYAPHAVSLSLLVLLRAITMNDAEFSALESVEALVPDAELAQDDRWDADVDPQTCMTNDMRTLLHGLCTKQLEEYPASLQASLHRWTQLGGPMLPGHANVVGDAMSNTSVSSAQEIAVERAALGLRIGEQEVLHAVCTKLLEVPTPPPPKRARRAQ